MEKERVGYVFAIGPFSCCINEFHRSHTRGKGRGGGGGIGLFVRRLQVKLKLCQVDVINSGLER